MNISYNWLRSFLPTDLSPQEVADTLTSIGLETGSVDEVETIPGGLRGLVIGHILTCEEHPNSDHLHITTVDIGADAPQQIVCGAPNVAAGQYVVVATLGTVLGTDTEKSWVIKRSKIRGVESFGMICSEVEIGVGSASDGIITLPEGAAPVGTHAAAYYQVESDYRLEVDITPNRVDATSHYGVARDLAARLSCIEGREIRALLPQIVCPLDAGGEPHSVEVCCSELCPRFEILQIAGIQVGESPKWLRDRLMAIGIRPINNVVDATNFVLHEYGQPLHCYDADKVSRGLVVRLARSGERLITLDGVERELCEQDIIIADAAGTPLCIGGVMGGLASGAGEETTTILLEAANFHPTSVRKSARRYALNTDSSFRFERGLDPANTHRALCRAASLIIEIAGGHIVGPVTDVYTTPSSPYEVSLSMDRLKALVGIEIPIEQVRSILGSLDIDIRAEEAGILSLLVPPYRVDVTREVDVVEEILRIYGYNNVPMPSRSLMSLAPESDEDQRYRLAIILSEQLVGAGFNEILNNSFTSRAYYEGLQMLSPEGLVTLLNPISKDLEVMRRTLLFGGLESITHNERRKANRFYFFEWGHTYHLDASRSSTLDCPLAPYRESERLGLWIAGRRTQGSWAHPDENASITELKATVYNLLARAGIDGNMIETREGSNDLYSTSLDIYTRSGAYLGSFGVVAPRLAKMLDTDPEVFYAELDWHAVCKQSGSVRFEASDLPKYPEVKRDLSLLLDTAIPYGAIEDVARRCERKLLKRMELFDVYEGKNLPSGKKSYAVAFYLRDDAKTMSDKQIDSIMQKIVKVLTEQLGASLR